MVVGRGRGDDMRDGPTNRPELEVIIQRLSRLRVPLRMSSREGLKAGHDLATKPPPPPPRFRIQLPDSQIIDMPSKDKP